MAKKKNARTSQPKPDNNVEFDFDDDFDIHTAIAVLDNGDFGTRELRFETGQLARQAGGSVTTYLDEDTMLLATTTASCSAFSCATSALSRAFSSCCARS